MKIVIEMTVSKADLKALQMTEDEFKTEAVEQLKEFIEDEKTNRKMDRRWPSRR